MGNVASDKGRGRLQDFTEQAENENEEEKWSNKNTPKDLGGDYNISSWNGKCSPWLLVKASDRAVGPDCFRSRVYPSKFPSTGPLLRRR